jgi:hypothetical protein
VGGSTRVALHFFAAAKTFAPGRGVETKAS